MDWTRQTNCASGGDISHLFSPIDVSCVDADTVAGSEMATLLRLIQLSGVILAPLVDTKENG